MIGCMNFLSFFFFLRPKRKKRAVMQDPVVAESDCASVFTTTTTSLQLSFMEMETVEKQSVSLTSFTLFPQLPTCIRVKIWKIANSQPRIIMVEHYHDRWDKSDKPPKHPATLAVSFESRNEALRAYHLVFEPRLGHPVAFNYKVDTLYLSNYDVTGYWRGQARRQHAIDHRASVRYLALNNFRRPIAKSQVTGEVMFCFLDINDIIDIIQWFPGTRELFFIPKYVLRGIMKAAGQRLEKIIHGRLRVLRRECCIRHDPDCTCTFWKFPKIHFMTLPQMQEYMGAEVLNVNDDRFGDPWEDDDDVISVS